MNFCSEILYCAFVRKEINFCLGTLVNLAADSQDNSFRI